MTADTRADALLYALMLLLPLSALIGRRVPVLRTLTMAAMWVGIFVIGLILVGQRERFDPYLARAAQLLKLDDQSVVGDEVRIAMSADGHFWARARIDGVERRLLIDSGATMTALSTEAAAAAGVKTKDGVFPMVLQTANGTVRAETGTVKELRFGTIVARDLAVVVSPAFGETSVLGMNFLSRLKSWRVEGRTLVLVPHHPQDFT